MRKEDLFHASSIGYLDGEPYCNGEEGFKYRCTDANSDHIFAMARFFVKCKRCTLYRLPTFYLYGELTVAPRSNVSGMTDAQFDKWLNRMNARLLEEQFEEEIGHERPL